LPRGDAHGRNKPCEDETTQEATIRQDLRKTADGRGKDEFVRRRLIAIGLEEVGMRVEAGAHEREFPKDAQGEERRRYPVIIADIG